MRVVSLLPSATEILYALGVEPVAVSHECDYPPAARGKPDANRSRIDATLDSGEINEQVAEAETEGGVYELCEDVLLEADPDLIITQGVCDVCAVDDQLLGETIADLDVDPEILTTHPHSLADVLDDIRRIGDRTSQGERARTVIDDLKERVRRVEDRATDDPPRAVVLDWMDPVMVAGHWIPEMVEIAGGTYGMADPGGRSRPRQFEDVVAYDPEVLIVAPCGFTLEQTTENSHELTDRDGYASLTATRRGAVYAMDGHHYVNRPGPRLVDTLEHFAGFLSPNAFGGPPGDVARPLSRTTGAGT